LSAQLERRWAGRRFDRFIMLTGSTDQDGAVLEWAHEAFGVSEAVVILTPSRASFDPERLAGLPLRVQVAEYPGKSRPLHAKLAWFDGPDGPAAVMGSANCSRSGWLPSQRRNWELVAVYDRPEVGDFSKFLDAADTAGPPPSILVGRRREEGPPAVDTTPVRLFSATWDSVRRRIDLCFDAPDAAAVALHVDDSVVAVEADDVGSFVRVEPEDWPALVRLEVDGELSRVVWVEDRRELLFGARSLRWEGALSGLGEQATPTEHRRMVRDLTQMMTALFDTERARSSPRATGERQSGSTRQAGALDPARLEDIVVSGSAIEIAPHLFGRGTSLSGILAAIFDLRGGDDDDDDENTEERTPVEAPIVELPPSVRRTIERTLKAHFKGLDGSDWLRQAAPTQVFQALAVPLALTIVGLDAGWLSRHEDLVLSMVDGLLARLGPRSPLLRTLNRVSDQEPERFGDGKLLASFRVAVALAPWPSRLERCLKLRLIDSLTPLRSCAEIDAVRVLLSGVRVAPRHRVVRDQAFEDLRALRRLEHWLHERWDELGDRQDEVPWFREGELVRLRGQGGRWARISSESKVDREQTWLEYLDGDAPLSARSDKGSMARIWRGGDAILVNVDALHRVGIDVPVGELVDLGGCEAGPRERRGVGGSRWE